MDSNVVPLRAPEASGEPADEPELNLARVIGPLLAYVIDHFGKESADDLARVAGLTLETLQQKSLWGSLEQGELLLQGVYDLVKDEQLFREIHAYRLREAFGPVRFLLYATTPATVLRLAFRTLDQVTAIGRVEILEQRRGYMRIRYRSTRQEGRLMCLSRQGGAAALPTLWGLPPARFTEDCCIAYGDETCDYHIHWYDRRRWWPSLAGAAAGAGVATVGLGIGTTGLVALPLVGLLLGYALELRRTERFHILTAEQARRAVVEMAREENAARRELLDLGQRQRHWGRLMEEQVAERTSALNVVVERLQQLRQERVTTIRGFSHDLRNPLSVLSVHADLLEEALGDHPQHEIIEENRKAIRQIEHLLTDLMEVAQGDARLAQHHPPERLSVGPIAERLRRRLRALAYGKPLRISVFSTREAPQEILIDPTLFDRVTDNLLTNAVKYTDAGSIVVEVGGSPGYLALKISDTGRGIAPERIEKIFSADLDSSSPRSQESYGVGLSVVVRLLGQIGGRVEVMSEPTVGTTFWALFPVESHARRKQRTTEVLDQVVRIKHPTS